MFEEELKTKHASLESYNQGGRAIVVRIRDWQIGAESQGEPNLYDAYRKRINQLIFDMRTHFPKQFKQEDIIK